MLWVGAFETLGVTSSVVGGSRVGFACVDLFAAPTSAVEHRGT